MAASKENITVNDFDKICRTCYSSHDLQNIYGLLNSDLISVEFILNKYTEIEFNSTDNLPKQICSKCIENLHKAYTFLNNCDLVNKALIESSARCANYYGDKMHEPSDKIPSCEIKEEPDDTFYSKDPQDDSNTENANDISFATVKVENLHSFIDIKEEPHAIDEIINLVENDCESEDWNMDDDGTNMSDFDSTDIVEVTLTTPEMTQAAINTSANLLPQKSREVYENTYSKFMDWRKTKNFDSFTENIFLLYFTEISTKMKPSTLWKIYSMLRTTISIKHNIYINNYCKLRAFLKSQLDGFHSKKSKTLTTEEVKRFINDAPDDIFLATKVASIVGIMGACRKYELWQMKIDHIEDLGAAVLIRVPDTKTKVQRKFTITGHFCTIFKKYLALRPSNIKTNNFFLNYQKGRCTRQVIGINKLGYMAKQIATFLKLRNPELYTGHCFRRTSATMLIDADDDIIG